MANESQKERGRQPPSPLGERQSSHQDILEQLSESKKIGMVALDREGRFVFINDCLALMNGRPAADHLGRTIEEVIPDLAGKLRPLFKRIIAEGITITDVCVKGGIEPLKEGDRHWTACFQPWRAEDGSTQGILGTIIETTKQQETEEELRKSEEKFSKAFNSTSTMMSISTPEEGRFVEVNEEFLRTLGYKREEIIGKTSKELGIIIDWENRERIKEDVLKGIRIKAKGLQLRAKDGTVHDCLFSADSIAIKDERLLLGAFTDITERKKTEEELRKSEDKFRLISHISPVGIYLTSAEGECTYANERWLEMAGLSLEEAKGKGWIEGIHPDDRKKVFENWERMVATRGKWGLEYRFLNKEGKTTWVQGVATPQEDQDGKVIGYVGANVDITEREKTEEIIKRMNESLILAQESSGSGSWDWDIEKDTFYWSDTFLKVFGMPEGVKTGFEAWTKTLHPDDAEMASRKTSDAIKNRTPLDSEYRIVLPNKEIRWIRATGKTIYRKEKPVRMVGLCTDITERKKTEKSLQQEQERARLYLDTVETIIVALDAEGKITTINKKGCRLFEKETKDLIGRSWFSTCLPDPEGKTRILSVFKRMMAGEIDGLEYYVNTIIDGKGRLRDIAWHNVLLHDESGMIVGTLSSGEDITDRKKAEESVKESERSYSELFKNLHSGFAHHQIVLDDQGTPIDYIFLKVNKAFEELTGLHEKDIVGKPITKAIPNFHEEEPDLIKEYGEIALTGGRKNFEKEVKALGKIFDINVYSTKKGFFTTVFNDVTEQKRNERTLKDQLDMLERFKNLKVDEILQEKKRGSARAPERAARPEAREKRKEPLHEEMDEAKLSLQELESIKGAVRAIEEQDRKKGGERR